MVNAWLQGDSEARRDGDTFDDLEGFVAPDDEVEGEGEGEGDEAELRDVEGFLDEIKSKYSAEATALRRAAFEQRLRSGGNPFAALPPDSSAPVAASPAAQPGSGLSGAGAASPATAVAAAGHASAASAASAAAAPSSVPAAVAGLASHDGDGGVRIHRIEPRRKPRPLPAPAPAPAPTAAAAAAVQATDHLPDERVAIA
jgi:hypothetical protein